MSPPKSEGFCHGLLGFWDQISTLTDSQWQYHACYLYRLEPPVRNDSGKNFIQKFTAPFDEDLILKTHGSGKFLGILNDTRKRKTIGKLTFSCYHPDHPPRIRLEQLAPGADESWRKWLLEVEAAKPQQAGDKGGKATTNDAALGAAIAELGAISRRLLDREQPGSALDEVQTDVDRINALLTGIKGLLPATPAQPDQLGGIVDKLLSALKPGPQIDPLAALERAAKILETLRPPEAREERDPLAHLGDLLEAAERVRSFAGGNPGPLRKEDTADLIKVVAPHVTGALHELGGILSTGLSAWLASRGAPTSALAAARAPAAPAVPSGSYPPGTRPAPSTYAGGTYPRPAAEAAPAEPPASVEPPAAEAAAEADPDVQQLAAFVPSIAEPLLTHLNSNASGVDFADWLITGYGLLNYRIIAGLGKPKILLALQLHPQLWANVSLFGPQLDTFLDDFLTWTPEESEPEEEVVPASEAHRSRAKPVPVA